MLVTIQKAVDSSPELRSKKELIEAFINSVNEVDDVMTEWNDYVKKQREEDLLKLIEEERLKPQETRNFIELSFREGEVKTIGTDIEMIMPPMSRLGKENREEKKKNIIEKIKIFFEKYMGIGSKFES